ncbi:hypothetical protein B0T10DRAFT_48042 [Thelonectria olida]|uniref:Uncharacterized protein n=1 Tax=Thelonectria olida TaxID=1576542 RepID=A0A9P9AS96_9HYPO|nr:hypothetical protein B0T10DRAFT_48042 [Thelonectria olida]
MSYASSICPACKDAGRRENSYCIRHRCCLEGCTKPRNDATSWWWCVDHNSNSGAGTIIFNSKAAPSKPRIEPQSVYCLDCPRTFACTEPITFQNGRGYCQRHRCTRPACAKGRSAGISWTCVDHLPERNLSASKPLAQNTATQEAIPKSTDAPAAQQKACQACLSNRQGKSKADEGWFCIRHRCVSHGCNSPRIENSAEGEPWYCSAHQPPKPVDQTLDEPPVIETPKKQRHSRMRSVLNWKTLLSSRKTINTPPPTSKEPSDDKKPQPPLQTETKAPVTQSTETPVVLTDEVPPPLENKTPGLGWHQCHAPACQERVLSEEVWVCQKHLDQGLFDRDDPPGYLDCPLR